VSTEKIFVPSVRLLSDTQILTYFSTVRFRVQSTNSGYYIWNLCINSIILHNRY